MPVTVSMIAKHVGLSRQTVGFILGDRGHLFREETRKRVLAAAEELGYRRNAAAMAMMRGRYNAIGLLQSVNAAFGLVHANFLAALMEQLRATNMHLSLGQVDDETLVDESAMPELMNSWAVDGLIISYVANYPERLVDILHRYRLPAIWTNVKHPFDAVYSDDYAGARDATELLLKMGHRRIAFVRYYDGVHYSSRDRWSGYSDAMHAAGLQPRRIGTHMGDWTSAEAHARRAEHVRAWVQTADRPSAVVIDDEEVATLVVHFAAVVGVALGSDLSVMNISRDALPVLGRVVSTMRIPTGDMAFAAVPLLLEKITTSGSELPSVSVPCLSFNPDATCRPPVG
jgi:LacI family transcriptional regulator